MAERTFFIAPSQYGKTVLACEYIMEKIDQKKWNPKRIVLFSPTAKSDQSMGPLIQKCTSKYKSWQKNNIFDIIDEKAVAFMEQLYNLQKEMKDSGKNIKPWLLIFDDCAMDLMDKSVKKINQRIAISGRHYSISTINLAQCYKHLTDPVQRQQISVWFIGRIGSQSALEDILSELSAGAGQSKKEALRFMIKTALEAFEQRNGHGFIVIYPYQVFGKKRIQKGDHRGEYADIQELGE